MKRILLSAFVLLLCALALPGAKTLDMWVVDTEGGKALLLLSPSGQSMLIDTGFPGFNDRDTTRIVEACQAAGVKKLDILVTTHYDMDHVNNTPSVLAKIPAATFVDHGPSAVENPRTLAAVKAYEDLAAAGKRLSVKPGDKIPFGDVDVLVVMSGTQALKTPAKGGGGANAACAGVERMTWGRTDEDSSENANSVGLLFTFGQFRMLDLADLTWNRELDLMCPANPIGTVDLFMASHHGHNISNSPALVNALRARVAIMNNGVKKMGMPGAIKLLKSAPGLQALYLLHWSANAPDDNPPNEYIANLQDSTDGKWIKVAAEKSGAFTVTNARTGESKTFKK
jgi:beta-lactamase superfamily II metal-dependent hydrolase